MRKALVLLAGLLLLTGCAGAGGEEAQALALRQRLAEGTEVTFTAEISANYIDTLERFSMDCRADASGRMGFTVSSPEEIAGIRGTVSGETGSLEFEDTVLAFPLMARERISPVSGPWILLQAMSGGYITACVREDQILHVTVEDTFAGAELTVDLWVREDAILSGEIAWQGIRQMSLIIDNFSVR